MEALLHSNCRFCGKGVAAIRSFDRWPSAAAIFSVLEGFKAAVPRAKELKASALKIYAEP